MTSERVNSWPRVALALSAIIALASFSAWLATGREGYTRWPNTKLALADAPPAEIEDDLLADIGFDDDTESGTEPASDIQSRFAFGLVPGGADLKHLLSLASGLAVSAGLGGVAGLSRFSTRRHSSNSPTTDHRSRIKESLI